MREGAIGVAYLITVIVNAAGFVVMGGHGVRGWRHAGKGQRKEWLRVAARTRTFWLAFWISLGAAVVNNLLPLALLPTLPVVAVWGLFLANLAASWPAIPIRLAIWRGAT